MSGFYIVCRPFAHNPERATCPQGHRQARDIAASSVLQSGAAPMPRPNAETQAESQHAVCRRLVPCAVRSVRAAINDGLSAIRRRIDGATRVAGRPDGSVALVAVSKFHPAAEVEAALAAGQRIFGENRVQEAQAKFPPLRARYPDLRLHIIGGLQTNKARAAVALADVIETLDRPALADAIARAAEATGRLPHLLVQVNIADEAQKSGIPLADAPAFIESCQTRFGAAVRGLMCIPPGNEDPTPYFETLATMGRRAGLAELSMGMSADFEAAIACGATSVRVGSAIFGARPPSGPAPDRGFAPDRLPVKARADD